MPVNKIWRDLRIMLGQDDLTWLRKFDNLLNNPRLDQTASVHAFLYYCLTDADHGAPRFATRNETKELLNRVIAAFNSVLSNSTTRSEIADLQKECKRVGAIFSVCWSALDVVLNSSSWSLAWIVLVLTENTKSQQAHIAMKNKIVQLLQPAGKESA